LVALGLRIAVRVVIIIAFLLLNVVSALPVEEFAASTAHAVGPVVVVILALVMVPAFPAIKAVSVIVTVGW
jgi:hypothetical protein